jgi:hypothetical protein
MGTQIDYFPELKYGSLSSDTKDDESQTLGAIFASRITSKHKKDVLMLLVGERGSGKSYTLLYFALRCAEEIAKRMGGKPEDYFTFKNVAVIQDEELEYKMRNLQKYNIYILDDAGVGWDSRAFASTMNRRLNHILQTCRTDNCVLLISVIDPFTIDKVPRTMVRYYAEIAEQLHDYGMNLVKVFRNKRLYREGKNLTPHLKFGHSITVRRWISKAPPEDLADEYDKVRDANAQKVKEQMSRTPLQPNELCVATTPTYPNHCYKCGHNWLSDNERSAQCPACFKRPWPRKKRIKEADTDAQQ